MQLFGPLYGSVERFILVTIARNLVLLVFAALFLVAGAFVQYRLDLIWKAKALFQTNAVAAQVRPVEQHKSVSSALLPLNVETIHFAHINNFRAEAGAICSMGMHVIVSDRLGHFFSYSLTDKKIQNLNWPLVNNHHAEFINSNKAKYENNFRVHGMACSSGTRDKVVFIAHEVFDPEIKATRFTVSSLTVDTDLNAKIDKWDVLFSSKPVIYPSAASYAANSAGGRIVYDSKGFLFVSIGDYGVSSELVEKNDPYLGSIVKIDLKTGAIKRVSKGHRNPQGLALLSSGELISTEQGPRGGDELNKIVEGADYGWPHVTYGTQYETYDWPQTDQIGRHDAFTKPAFAWVPSVATTQVLEIKTFHKRWKSDLLVASLKAGTLYRLRYENEVVRYVEPIWIGPRLRDLVETEDGQIAIWTDSAELLLMSVDQKDLVANARGKPSERPPTETTCMNCHHVGPTNPSHSAPTLSKIMGKQIASDDFANYTSGLRAKTGVWTEERLRTFISQPQAFSPGSTMPPQQMTNFELERVIRYLVALD